MRYGETMSTLESNEKRMGKLDIVNYDIKNKGTYNIYLWWWRNGGRKWMDFEII